MPTALVVGGGGFIGRAIVAALSEPGRAANDVDQPAHDLEVVVLDRIAAPADPGRIVLDLAAPDAATELGQLLRSLRPSVVVNAAGATEGSATSLAIANVVGTAMLLDALAAVDAPARYVHLGSAAEYGPGPAGVPVAEDVRGRPVSAYGATKLAATELVVLARAAGLDATVLRPFNVLGPAMRASTLPGAAARRLADAVDGGARQVAFGRLDAVRDFVDVTDVGRAVAMAAVTPRSAAAIINVGSGDGHTARELVEAMAAALGFDGEITETEAGSTRSSGVDWQVADVHVARAALGWSPHVPFEVAARRAASGGPPPMDRDATDRRGLAPG